MPSLAKARLVIAVVSSAIAATLLDTGYGFGVAGLVVIILIGPYIAVDSRELLKTNLLVVAALIPVIVVMAVRTFDAIGTIVFVIITISAGVSSATPVEDPDRAWDALVKAADQHLYRAKGDGRNRVVAG
jgi:GGDEF domain-containing protein